MWFQPTEQWKLPASFQANGGIYQSPGLQADTRRSAQTGGHPLGPMPFLSCRESSKKGGTFWVSGVTLLPAEGIIVPAGGVGVLVSELRDVGRLPSVLDETVSSLWIHSLWAGGCGRALLMSSQPLHPHTLQHQENCGWKLSSWCSSSALYWESLTLRSV